MCLCLCLSIGNDFREKIYYDFLITLSFDLTNEQMTSQDNQSIINDEVFIRCRSIRWNR